MSTEFHGDQQTTSDGDSGPIGPRDTPFLTFWGAVNEGLKLNGQPDLTFGPAKRLWTLTLVNANSDQVR